MIRGSPENRRLPRIDVKCPASYREDAGGRSGEGTCLQISGNGMLLLIRESLAPGTRMRVSVRPLNDITPPLDALVEVVRAEPDGAGGDYRIAATIHRIMD